MKKLSLLLIASMFSLLAFAQTETNAPTADQTGANAPPMLGIYWAKGTPESLASGSPATSPDMTYHGGKIMPTANATAIFWGTSWANYNGDKISGMDSWYQGFGNSDYAKTSDEYTGSNGQVGPATSYAGHYTDTSTAGNGDDTGVIAAEVCKMITNPDPSGNGYYPVYVDKSRGANDNYCAYHSFTTCHGTPVQFAFFFKLDGDSGCDPHDTSGLHSQGLAAIANVSGHELSEARTDPDVNAWYDSQGMENGDKCAWTFGAPLVTFSNGTQWKIQGEWSNIAYNNGSGYPNQGGLKGCLSGLPIVTLTPSSVNFGSQWVGYPSSPQPVTLANHESVSLSIASITTSGDYSQTNNCGASLKPNSSCTISVVFTPKAKGTRTGTLTVVDNAPGSPQTASLTGVGVAPPPVTLLPSSVDFGDQQVGYPSSPESVTLTNNQSVSLSITSIKIQPGGNVFSQTNNCGTSLKPNSSCTINVVFTPIVKGTRTGTLTVTDNGPGSPQTTSLSGTGVGSPPPPQQPTQDAPGSVTLTPSTLNFGFETVGEPSDPLSITLTNNQSVSLSISKINTPSLVFSQTNNCGTLLSAHSSCTINVVFTPRMKTNYAGLLNVFDSGPGSPQQATLTGTGD